MQTQIEVPYKTRLTYANYGQDISDRLHETVTYNNVSHSGSNKYSLVKTCDIVEHIKNNTDLVPVSYKETNSKKVGQQAHMIRFRSKALLDSQNAEIPELVLLNSYDTTKAFKLFFGVVRIACFNGLICGNEVNSFSHRHINFDFNALQGYLDNLSNVTSQTFETIKTWKAKQLTLDERKEMATKTLLLRDYHEFTEKTHYEYYKQTWVNQDVNRMLKPSRSQDLTTDLWTTYNVIQEAAIRGKNLYSGKLRALKSVTTQVKLNRELWDLAAQYA